MEDFFHIENLADPENPQILIGGGRLVYGFQNGDFKGLASVDLKNQTRRQLAVKYQDGLRLLGIDGDCLYIRQMAEAAGQGRDGQGNFFCESMPVQEVIWYDLGTTESRDVVSFPGENSVGRFRAFYGGRHPLLLAAGTHGGGRCAEAVPFLLA